MRARGDCAFAGAFAGVFCHIISFQFVRTRLLPGGVQDKRYTSPSGRRGRKPGLGSAKSMLGVAKLVLGATKWPLRLEKSLLRSRK